MDFVTGFATGWAMGKKMFEGGGGKYDIYIVDYTETNLVIKIIADQTAETPDLKEYSFSFTMQEFKATTILKTSKGEAKRTWKAQIITAVFNSENQNIWTLTPDDSGKIIAVYDQNGNELLNGTTTNQSVSTDTPEGTALGFALAFDKAQESLIENLINAYKQGVDDENDINVPAEEPDLNIIELKGNGAVFVMTNKDTGVVKKYYGSYIVNQISSGGVMVYAAEGEKVIEETIRNGKTIIRKSSERIFVGCNEEDFDLILTGDVYDISGNLIEIDGVIYYQS